MLLIATSPAERRLRYHGAIDDSRDAAAVGVHYLRDALDALLADGSVVPLIRDEEWQLA